MLGNSFIVYILASPLNKKCKCGSGTSCFNISVYKMKDGKAIFACNLKDYIEEFPDKTCCINDPHSGRVVDKALSKILNEGNSTIYLNGKVFLKRECCNCNLDLSICVGLGCDNKKNGRDLGSIGDISCIECIEIMRSIKPANRT